MAASDPTVSEKDVMAMQDDRPKKLEPNVFTYPYFLYIDPLIRYGHKKRLEEEDLREIPQVNTRKLHARFSQFWEKEKKKENPDLKRSIINGQTGRFFITALLYLGSTGMSLVGPILLQYIVDGISCRRRSKHKDQCDSVSMLYYYMIGLCVSPLLQSLCENHQRFQLFIIGTAARNSLMAAIFRKCLRLSASAMQQEPVGKVVTLMSNDSQKIQDTMYSIHNLWGAPIYVIVVMALLYRILGWAAFVGLGTVLLMTFLTSNMSKVFVALRKKQVRFVDKRITTMSEVISGIQMIKYYAWEVPFENAVRAVRKEEGKILRSLAVRYGSFFAIVNSIPILVAVACFGASYLAGNKLRVGQVYSALALFSLLRVPLGFLPMQVTSWLNALVSLKRIRKFLQADEAEEMEYGDAAPGEVMMEDADFKWSAESEEPTLKGISFTARPGSLTMVVGQVGSGKSSLLSALIGHMPKVKGKVAVGGHIAYTAQTSWIINESLRDNILLGLEFEQARYDEAVRVAQLGPDLAILPNGDLTEIGDRGINLSGGQKQRVSIARAVYARTDVVIMDDPLSAVDAHVGKAIMDDCIRGSLKGRTVVLATNALQHLQDADHIIWLEDGSIQAQGNYDHLVASGFDVASMLRLMHPDAEEAVQVGVAAIKDSDKDSETIPAAPDAPLNLSQASSSASSTSSTSSASSVADTQPDKCAGSKVAGAADAAADGTVDGAGSKTAGDVKVEAGEINTAANTTEGAKGGAEAPKGEAKSESHTVRFTEVESDRKSVDVGRKGKEGTRKSVDVEKGGKRSLELAGARKDLGVLKGTLSTKESLTRSKRNLTGVEEREEGSISGRMAYAYIAAAGGALLVCIQLALYAGERGSQSYTDTWIGLWATDVFHQTLWFYLSIYASLGVAFCIISLLRSLNFMFGLVRATLNMSDQLLTTVMRLPKSFFDTNPAGRVLNRFSRDTEIMDSTLVWSLSMTFSSLAGYLNTMVVISIATKWFAIVLVPITMLYVVMQRYYIPSARELQRIESVTRSPIYSKFGEALAGVPTIRAYRKQATFVDIGDTLMQHNANAFLTQKMANAWLTMRLDIMGAVILTLTSVLVIEGAISPALAGLALVYALEVTRFLQMGATSASRAETDLNSVERIVQYLSLPLEAEPETTPEILATLPPSWPSKGDVVLSGVEMKYRPDTPLVLRGVSFTAECGQKVGIVGRTGSGKSSLFVTIFRMVEPSGGTITIDGVDITTLGVRHLRRSLGIIPQDPFLFTGTVRRNLDPFDSYSDEELWRVVELAGLKPAVSGLEGKLMAMVTEQGSNFSQGQRQLFCLARSLLKHCHVLMLDEATASVDVETDAKLQLVIREEFADCTVLTIAHRINTIMDSDKVVVMAGGVVEETGSVSELMAKPEGSFKSLVEQSTNQLPE